MTGSLTKIAFCVLMLGALLLPLPSTARNKIAAPEPIVSITLNGSGGIKYPQIAGSRGQVNVAAGAGRTTALVWSKADSATAFPDPFALGPARGQGDYASASVAMGADGSVYSAWFDTETLTMFMRMKPANGDWGPTRALMSGKFIAYTEIGATTDGAIFVLWSENNYIRYIRSVDGGASWSAMNVVTGIETYNAGAFAAGPNGMAAVAHGTSSGQVAIGIWNGAAFVPGIVANPPRGDFLADPSVAIAPNGRIYVAWRAVEGGIHYAEQQSNGSWPRSTLAGGSVNGTPGVATDPASGVHIVWNSDAGGSRNMYYAYKSATGGWEGPIMTSGAGASYISAAGAAATMSSRIFGHAVFEYWVGNTSIRYNLFGGPFALGAQPKFTSGMANGKNPIPVNFDVTGTPTQVRWRWGAPPTDTQSDSNGFQPFASSMQIAPPAGLPQNKCTSQILYTQVRDGNGVEPSAKFAGITLDSGVQAYVAATNPKLAGLPSTYSRIGIADDPIDGSSDGDPRYTRKRNFYLGILNAGDCSALHSFQIDSQAPIAISNNYFASALPLPGSSTPGPRSFNVTVSDTLGLAATSAYSLIYDPGNIGTDQNPNWDGLPVLTGTSGFSPTISVPSPTTNNIVVTLNFNNISVTDNLYGSQGEGLGAGRQFWGMWVAVAKSASAASDPPPDSTQLRWFPIRIINPSSSFSVRWSLFSGQNFASLQGNEGRYVIYARALDGAGNASVLALKTEVTLTAPYSNPTIAFPLLRKP